MAAGILAAVDLVLVAAFVWRTVQAYRWRADARQLRRSMLAMAERIAAQSEALSRKAERAP